VREGWESWGWSAWGGEGCGETLEQLPVLEGDYKKAGDRLFSKACCDRTTGNGFKLKEGRFRLDIRKKFL